MEAHKITFDLPFDGFYCSIHGDNIDDYFSMLLDDADTNFDEVDDKTDYKALYEAYTKKYVDVFNSTNDTIFEFIKVSSPREYNFDSDRIVVTVSLAEIEKVYTNINKDKFADYVREELRESSGFIPYYSNNLNDWGDISQWDHAQFSLLVKFLVDSGVYEDCQQNLEFGELILNYLTFE